MVRPLGLSEVYTGVLSDILTPGVGLGMGFPQAASPQVPKYEVVGVP